MSSRSAGEPFNIGAIPNAALLPDQPARPLGMNTAHEQMMDAQGEFSVSTKGRNRRNKARPSTPAT